MAPYNYKLQSKNSYKYVQVCIVIDKNKFSFRFGDELQSVILPKTNRWKFDYLWRKTYILHVTININYYLQKETEKSITVSETQFYLDHFLKFVIEK